MTGVQTCALPICRFVELPTLYENQLRGYVFREERRLHASKRDDDFDDYDSPEDEEDDDDEEDED